MLCYVHDMTFTLWLVWQAITKATQDLLIGKPSRELCATFVVQPTWSCAIKVGTLSLEDTHISIGVVALVSPNQPQVTSSA